MPKRIQTFGRARLGQANFPQDLASHSIDALGPGYASEWLVVHASINIPHRTRLKLEVGRRYRFKVAAHKPFGAGDLWIVAAR